MAKIPGSLLDRSHPAQGINRDPVTQLGIRAKQGIGDDYSSSRQTQWSFTAPGQSSAPARSGEGRGQQMKHLMRCGGSWDVLLDCVIFWGAFTCFQATEMSACKNWESRNASVNPSEQSVRNRVLGAPASRALPWWLGVPCISPESQA